MSNIIGMITVLLGAVTAGVSVWFVSRQQRKQGQEQHQEIERRLLAQLEQERHQRQEVERQRQQEQQQCEAAERRLLVQLEQERRQRQEVERQRQQEQQQCEAAERRLLVQLEQERHQRQEIERQRQQEQQHHQETEHRLLAQLEQERRQREEIERQRLAQLEEVSLKDSNQQPNQETIPPEHHLSSWESFKDEIEGGIGDLENFRTNFVRELANPTPTRMPNFVSNLRDLLASRQWEKADKETLKIMLQMTDREKKGWLDVASIENFPCEELRAIDQLWLQSSNGRFGFSVQKRIWKSVEGSLKADDKIYQVFGDRVEWRVNKNWLKIDDFTFKLSAPIGHLPATAIRLGGLSWGVDGFWWEKREAYVFLLSEKDW